VGKSSLINALVRRPLARTSGTPGKTRLINVYRVRRGSTPACYLVDLPGYGFARRPRPGETSADDFRQLTDSYFARPGRRGVLLLVDARHPGLEADMQAWNWLKAQRCARAVVGTKADKLTREERVRHTRELETLFELPVALVSARTGEGLDDLWKMIASLPNRTAA
jgi:GTP-binding protein